MVDLEKLNGIIAERGLKQNKVAEAVGMSNYTLSLRLSGSSDFKAEEAYRISEFLKLTQKEKLSIFFANGVEHYSTQAKKG